MMRSMYAGVSGLKNHQMRMDIIGNNIANVNTVGFKKSRVVFKDSLYQAMRGASTPGNNTGGTNPMAVGLGMTINSVDTIHTPSPATFTGKGTDMAVDGNGYFVVANGTQKYYTRAGSFDFDTNRQLVNSSGQFVQGWLADKKLWDADGYKIATTADAGKIDISSLKTLQPTKTTSMKFSGNLSSNNSTIPIGTLFDATTPALSSEIDKVNPASGTYDNKVVTSKEVYDSLGNKQIVYFKFFKTDTKSDGTTHETTWHCDISLDPKFAGNVGLYSPPVAGSPPVAAKATGGTPDAAGTLMTTTGSPVTGYEVIRVKDISFGEDGLLTETSLNSIDLNIDRTAQKAEPITFTADLSKLTQYEPKSTAWAESQNGYNMGTLSSVSVGIDGTISGVYSNNESRGIARVAVANFVNPAGLLQAGGSLFQESTNSGSAQVGAPGEQGIGPILPSSLEMSNVDLSEEFTDMIITQRGFQANSRIITTSDEMLQELVNLKR